MPEKRQGEFSDCNKSCKEVTVDEARNAMIQLQDDLKNMLIAYTEEYGVGIDSIHIDPVRTPKSVHVPASYRVRIHAELLYT